MSVIPVSGCLTVKQITQLNDRFPELAFELGDLLDTTFAKILGAEFNICDAADIPTDTAGVGMLLCVIDGVCSFIPKSDITNEIVTSVTYDNTNHTISYLDENGATTVLDLNKGVIAIDPVTCEITYTDECNDDTVLALPQAPLPTLDGATCTFTFEDAKGNSVDLAIPQAPLPTFDATTCTFTFEDAKNNSVDVVVPYTENPTFDEPTCTFTFTDAKGIETQIAVPQPAAPTFDDVTCELVFEDAKGVETRVAVTNINTGFDDTTTPTTDFVNYLGHNSDGKVVAVPLPDQIDVKCVPLCDVGNDNKPYILEVTTNLTQGTKQTATLEIDGVTPYAPLEPGVYKPDDLEIQTAYMFKKDSIPNGVTETYWEIGGAATGTNGNGIPGLPQSQTPPITDIFTSEDSCGLLIHPNEPDLVQVIPNAIPTDPTDSDIAHESCLDFWINVPECGAKIAARVNGWSNYAVYFASCNSKLQEVTRGINFDATGTAFFDIELGSIARGFFHVRSYSHDPGSRGKTIYQWDIGDGNGYVDIPTESLLSEKPAASCVQICYNKTTGEQTFLDGTAVDPLVHEIFACDPCTVPSGLPPLVQDVSPTYHVEKAWLFRRDSVANGVNEDYWEIGPDATGTNGNGIVDSQASTPIDQVFTQVDECGMLEHPNPTDQQNKLTEAVTTDPSSAQIAHESKLDFYFEVPASGADVAFRVNGFSSYAVYFGTCTSKPGLVEQGFNNTAAGSDFLDISLGSLSQGFYHAVIFVHDPGSAGKIRFQWDIADGNGFVDLPEQALFCDRPSANAAFVCFNKEDRSAQFLDGTPIDQDLFEIFPCDPCDTTIEQLAATDDPSTVEQKILCDKADTGEITKFIRHTVYDKSGKVKEEYDTTLDTTVAYTAAGIVGDCDEKCGLVPATNYFDTVDDTGEVQLDLSLAEVEDYCDVTCAKVQVLGGEAFFTVNNGAIPNGDPTETVGFKVCDKDIIELGCCGDGQGHISELEEFRIIAAPGQTVQIQVMFFRPEST